MDLEYPAHFQAGIKYKLLPDLQVNVDVGWTDYKAWDKFKFEFDRQVSALKLQNCFQPIFQIVVWLCLWHLSHRGTTRYWD